MKLLYLLFFVLGLIVYFSACKMVLWKRLTLSVLIFILPSLLVTFLLLMKGDKPLPGSRPVTVEELEKEGK